MSGLPEVADSLSKHTVESNMVPKHVAIIMDGNGRWAKERNLPRSVGHNKGADAIRNVVESCIDHGIGYLTLYAFSSENWKRPEDEVASLMQLLRSYLSKEIKHLNKHGVVLNTIGDISKFDQDIQDKISQAKAETKTNKNLVLTIALNYGARQEITQAVQSLCRQAKDGSLDIETLTTENVSNVLDTAQLPEVDLLIRTGGELRISNFLLWQVAYAELLFLDVLWPSFGKAHMVQAVEHFKQRERRYGTF